MNFFYPGGSRRDAPRHECYGSESAEEPFTLPLRETRQFLYRSESIRRCRGEVAVPYAAVMCTCVSQNGELFAPSSEGILVVVALLLLRVQSIDVDKETETVCNTPLIIKSEAIKDGWKYRKNQGHQQEPRMGNPRS